VRYPQGILVSCEIPWDDKERLLEGLFRKEVQMAISKGFTKVYIFGTAGEGYAVDTANFQRIVEIFRDETKDKNVLAQVGVIGLSTATIVERLEFAHRCGFRDFQISLPCWSALRDDELLTFFKDVCGLPDGSALNEFLLKHNVDISPSFGSNAGLVFSGTPGHSVQRIKAEQKLFEAVRGIVERPRQGTGNAPAVLAEARQHLQSLGTFAWAFEPAESLLEKPPGHWGRALMTTLLVPPVFATVAIIWAACWYMTYSVVFGRSITLASAGALISLAGPTASIFSPRTRTTQPSCSCADSPSKMCAGLRR